MQTENFINYVNASLNNYLDEKFVAIYEVECQKDADNPDRDKIAERIIRQSMLTVIQHNNTTHRYPLGIGQHLDSELVEDFVAIGFPVDEDVDKDSYAIKCWEHYQMCCMSVELEGLSLPYTEEQFVNACLVEVVLMSSLWDSLKAEVELRMYCYDMCNR